MVHSLQKQKLLSLQSRIYRFEKKHDFDVFSVSEDAEKKDATAKEIFSLDKRTSHNKTRVYDSDGGDGDAPRAVRTR